MPRPEVKIHTPLRLSLDASLSVGDLDTDLLGAGKDVDTLSCRYRVRDLCGEGGVVHEEEVNIGDIVDEESLVAAGHQVAGFAVGAVSDLGHSSLALEASADTVVDTLGLAP